MQETVFVELKDVTEELAARVRAGEIEVEVTTPRAKWWQTVAAHTYKTVRVAEGRRYVADEAGAAAHLFLGIPFPPAPLAGAGRGVAALAA